MLSTVLAALSGATGLGALLTPVLLHLTARRSAVQAQNTSLIDQLQQERDEAVRSRERTEANVAALWDYVLRLRYWMVKGATGDPPTMPDGLTITSIRDRVGAP